MLLDLKFAQKENLEIQAIFERKEIHILLEEGEKDNIAAISLFQFVNWLKAESPIICLFL